MTEKGDGRIHILIVEDDSGRAENLQREIKELLGEENVVVVVEPDHERAAPVLLRPHPYDVLILDRFRGNPGNGDDAGQMLWQEILNVKFVPVLIHTAGGCDLDPPFPKDNPILRCFLKTSDSDIKIAEHLASIRKHLDELREVQQEINAAFKSVLLVTSATIWKEEANEEQRAQLLVRSARRRLAATMDSVTEIGQEKLLFWEQYIYPPIEADLLMGDLLRTGDGNKNDPAAYRLVLTPSCDLAMGAGRRTIDNILVAKCRKADAYLKALGLTISSALTDKAKDRLSKSFNDAHSSGYIFLPGYKSVLPSMTACLRELELIPITEIASPMQPNGKFARVVSIDSPFREQIAWAYLQIAARPGMPERDALRCIQDNFEPSTPSVIS